MIALLTIALTLVAPPYFVRLVEQQATSQDVAALQMKAESGDAEAQRLLGEAFEEGTGVEKSDQSAVEWYRKAALQGDAIAAADLGVMYWTGRGVPQDRAEAVQWYHRAAKKKNPMALYNLGAASYDGEGAPENVVHAFAWFSLADEAGSAQGNDALKRMELELKTDKKVEAWAFIGEMYDNGYTLPQDAGEAARWYEKAAVNGDPVAAMHLALLLAGNRLGAPNYPGMLRWCQAAADQNYAPGLYCVGQFYEAGLAGQKDLGMAAQWYLRAVQLGDAGAAAKLANMYWNGDGVKLDRVTAYMFALLASSVLDEAKQDIARFRPAMSAKEVRKAEQKAREFRQKQSVVVMRKSPPQNGAASQGQTQKLNPK